MAEATQTVDFLITARDQATRILQGVGTSIEGLSRSWGALQGVLAGTGVAFAMERVVGATIEAERASLRLDAVLKATGQSAGITRGELNAIAEDLKGKSPFDDDEIRKGLASLLRFRNIQLDVFREAARLAPDLAAALDTDVTAAYTRLGRALEDPEKGLRALREAGLNVTSALDRVKKVMAETGDVAAAQRIVLEELQKSVGGAAAGENAGLYGSVKAVGKAWDDWMKAVGGSETAVRRMKQIADWGAAAIRALTPEGKAARAETPGERAEASRAAGLAEWERVQEQTQKNVDEQIKKIMEERAKREERLREEDLRGWVAHAEAIVNEDFQLAQMLAKIQEDEAKQSDKLRQEETEKELAFRQLMGERVTRLQQDNMTELELIAVQLAAKQEILVMSFLTEEEYARQSALVFQNYEKEKTRIQDDEIKKRWGISQVYRQLDLASSAFFFGQLASMMQTQSRTMFEVAKKGAIAETIIQTYRGAQGAFAALSSIPIIGPVLGAIAAAAAIVAGLARVQQIRSTQFGGAGGATPVFNAIPGTGIPSEPVGGQASPPSLPQAAAPRTKIDVIVEGPLTTPVTYQTIIDEIVPGLQAAFDNGADLRLTLRTA